MKYKICDLISFDGSMEKTKDVYYSGIRTKKEINERFPNNTHITRILVTRPNAKFRVTKLYPPYYLCEKLWESGDEEIPVSAGIVFIHEKEAIPYDKSFDGKVINKKKII